MALSSAQAVIAGVGQHAGSRRASFNTDLKESI